MNAKEVSELKAGDVVYDYNGIYKIIGTYDSFHKWYKVHDEETQLILKELSKFYNKTISILEQLKKLDENYKEKTGGDIMNMVLYNILNNFTLCDLDYLDYSDLRNEKAAKMKKLNKIVNDIKSGCDLGFREVENLKNAYDYSSNVIENNNGSHTINYIIKDINNHTCQYSYNLNSKLWTVTN